jgi:lipopolysaccharide heptosyltransferase II
VTLAEKLASRPPARVLVVQTAFLGDTVFTSALVASIARRFPAAEIDLCVAPRGRDVALAMPGVAFVHPFDKRGKDWGPFGLRRWARRLKTRQYPLAVLPHQSLRTALLAWMADIPVRVGFDGAPGAWLYTERVPTEETAFLRRDADLARALGATPAGMRLVPRPEWVAAARAALGPAAGEKLAAICLGSEWATKVWPASRARDLVQRLSASGFRPVLLGGRREAILVRQIGAAGGAIDTTGNSVGEALAILSLSALAVGGDTGLVHAARAMGVPTVAVFGPTPSSVHAFGARERAVSLGLECSPCSVHGSRRCPLGHHRCLADLDAERVAAACAEVTA